MQVSDNKLVTAQYQLYVKNSDGSLELMEETTPDAPLKYLHGIGMMMPKFEELMNGRKAGEKFEFSIDCADAHGKRSDDNIIELPISVFSQDGKLNENQYFRGAIVPLVDTTGQRIKAEILEIGEKGVSVDLNHPLAGEDLVFKVEIIDIHEPTDKELRSLTSCNCGSCNCSENGCGSCGK
jgi:FKBP-type peptidyl-prolyl cis-trans isomerase SlyD